MNSIMTFCTPIQLLTVALLLAGLCGAHTAQAQARFSYSADGSEVKDNITGLVWQRCSAGQKWSAGTATCTGRATIHPYEIALSFAGPQTGWRLPNVKELSSITDKSRRNPAIDVTAFPETPSNLFWTSTAIDGGSVYTWYVSFYDGEISRRLRGFGYRSNGTIGYIRLVR